MKFLSHESRSKTGMMHQTKPGKWRPARLLLAVRPICISLIIYSSGCSLVPPFRRKRNGVGPRRNEENPFGLNHFYYHLPLRSLQLCNVIIENLDHCGAAVGRWFHPRGVQGVSLILATGWLIHLDWIRLMMLHIQVNFMWHSLFYRAVIEREELHYHSQDCFLTALY